MLTYLPTYGVLICNEHQYAIYSLDEHLKRYYKLSIQKRKELQQHYSSYTLQPPTYVRAPAPYSTPLAELGAPENALLCYYTACNFISISRSWIKKHIN